MRSLVPGSCVEASNEISSIIRSITEWRRRAPMFSTIRLASVAMRAISRSASGSNWSSTSSVFISSVCWRIRLATGSVRILYISVSVRPFSSTRIGRRPCSSASRSDGFAVWNAPDAMNRMWSVSTLPYFVLMVEPSMSGSRSRCTPSALASAEPMPRKSRELQILSISSMKTIEGEWSSATRKSSRTSFGPSPRYFWISSDPTIRRNVADVWLATALASSVFPVPGSPYKITPLGGLMPISS
mmetsp:Transcript_14597/g.25682  ORF Transcript_14597/g.25682 Transcript_14597/m.25682 type:complete len:243 (-) Transcript_14597:721-1449(-)